ncbi:MADS-box transcription factor 23-like [Nicotiana sylvestris]|uniref:MADS-box transcription factor 23-like n=2 Tax=Nicotiana TaxID=4085 RepID=A0A1S3Z1N3_TOBAC|nr:PREDICTED: MADS-box transcription factor 23-like [Nicotiana sylvestris]XP_016458072.1 PREDICTED: MADS-box transcription factor 23-like [Nicotiana tabacum]
MGTGKKKIEIKQIMKAASRMVTFSKRRKGLFKKALELESMTGARVAAIVFSPTGKPYISGDVNSAIDRHFSSSIDPSSGSYDVSSGSSESRSSPLRNGLCNWLENIDVEECENLNELLLLKEQLEGTREKLACMEDSESFLAMFMS